MPTHMLSHICACTCAQKHPHTLTCVCTHTLLHTCTHADSCMHTGAHTYTYMQICVYKCAIIRIHRCPHACTRVHMLSRAHADTCACTCSWYTRTCSRTHVHVHAHTYTCSALSHAQVRTCMHTLSRTCTHMPPTLSEEPGSHHSCVAGTWMGLAAEAQPGSAGHAPRDIPVTSPTEPRAKVGAGPRRSPQHSRPQDGHWGSGSAAGGTPQASWGQGSTVLPLPRAPRPCPTLGGAWGPGRGGA